MAGPLSGLRVIEMAGIGPGPFCGMLLADLGADVLRIDPPEPSGLGIETPAEFDYLARGKRAVVLDLKSEAGGDAARALISRADALIEGFRPGVMERLGLGPGVCLGLNPRLVYGRVTGWGQEGPLARAAGHDLNYIALTGALHAIGPNGGPPVPPLNLVGDFAGGSLYLAMGLLAALLEARTSGKGQVIDAAIVDGTFNMMTMFHSLNAMGGWQAARGGNLLDGGAPFYSVYECADGRFVTVAAVESKFYAELLRILGLSGENLPDRTDRRQWPALHRRFAETFLTADSQDWCARLEGSEACFAPVLHLGEASGHPHMAARACLVEVDGHLQPAPAPRFSRTGLKLRGPAPHLPEPLETALTAWSDDAGIPEPTG